MAHTVLVLSPTARRAIKALTAKVVAGTLTPAAARAQVRAIALRAVAS